jgi:hypothetical protein
MSHKIAAEQFRLLSSKKNQGLKEKGTQHKVRKLNFQAHDLTNQLSISYRKLWRALTFNLPWQVSSYVLTYVSGTV